MPTTADCRNHPKTVAIIQTRMGSRRLPGKALRTIGGYSVVAHIVHRLRQVPALDQIAVATTERREDDRIAEHCERMDVPCLRGPEHDVLERYLMAGEFFCAGIIVRATGDNPMIDPGSVQRVLSTLQSGEFDFVIEQGLPKGCCGEAFTMPALRRAKEVALLAEHREHVTLVMKQDQRNFHVCVLKAPEELYRPDVNLSIDTEEEYRAVRAIMEFGDQDALSKCLADALAGVRGLPSNVPLAAAR